MASTILTDLARKSLSRRIPVIYSKEVREYSLRVGSLLWAWNRLHGKMSSIFSSVASPNYAVVGRAVWHALKADSAQRDILTAAMAERSEIPFALAEAIEWLVDVQGKLSQHRNDAAHVPMSPGIEDKKIVLFPDFFDSDPARAGRLSRSDLKAFHRMLLGDLLALGEYAQYVDTWLKMWGLEPTRKQPTLPDRPPLQAIPLSEIPLSRSQRDHQRQKAGHRAQQKALQPRGPKQSTAQRRNEALARDARKNGK